MGDDRSVWPDCAGLHAALNAQDNAMRRRKAKLTAQTCAQFGLWAETRPHEVGIGSNRGSADHGEFVLGSCTHRPSDEQSRQYPKTDSSTPFGEKTV